MAPALGELTCARAQLLRRVRLFDPIDCSPPGAFVQGIPQARMLEQAAISCNSVLAISFHNLKSPEEGRAKYVILGWLGMNGKELSK